MQEVEIKWNNVSTTLVVVRLLAEERSTRNFAPMESPTFSGYHAFLALRLAHTNLLHVSTSSYIINSHQVKV